MYVQAPKKHTRIYILFNPTPPKEKNSTLANPGTSGNFFLILPKTVEIRASYTVSLVNPSSFPICYEYIFFHVFPTLFTAGLPRRPTPFSPRKTIAHKVESLRKLEKFFQSPEASFELALSACGSKGGICASGLVLVPWL